MKGDETSYAYLNRAKEYAYVVANIGEAFKEKDLVMLVVSGLCEDYNGLKSTLLARQHVAAPSWLLLSSENRPWWLKAHLKRV
ncbi:hypothetical protein Tco_1475514 [Tanacetum coccineum]